MISRTVDVVNNLAPVFRRLNIDTLTKRSFEFGFWCKEWLKFKFNGSRKAFVGVYEPCFTALVNLTREDFSGKRILDIGCGPKGTLEWADMASERIGLDPLVDQYRLLGINRHLTRYVKARSEAIPFPDGYFDIVSCYNALDHVDDINRTVGEIKRVIVPGGLFLLSVDVNHAPTVAEPVTIQWDIVEKFKPELLPVYERRYEQVGGLSDVLDGAVDFDPHNGEDRPGKLVVKFQKVYESPAGLRLSERFLP